MREEEYLPSLYLLLCFSPVVLISSSTWVEKGCLKGEQVHVRLAYTVKVSLCQYVLTVKIIFKKWNFFTKHNSTSCFILSICSSFDKMCHNYYRFYFCTEIGTMNIQRYAIVFIQVEKLQIILMLPHSVISDSEVAPCNSKVPCWVTWWAASESSVFHFIWAKSSML